MNDPVLLRAARKLAADMRNAERMGAPYSPSDVEATMRELTKNKYGADDFRRLMSTVNTDPSLANVGRAAAQGFGFNFVDEVAGGLLGEGAQEDFRLREEAFAREHPWWNAGAGMLGGAAWAPVLPAATATTVGRAATLGALSGAGYGAVSGVGAGEDARSRTAGGLIGAGGGALLGGAMGGGVAKARSLLSPLARAERRVGEAIEQSGGERVVVPVLSAADDAGRGKEFMLGDATRRLQGELDVAANANANVNARLADALEARQSGQAGRVQADVTAMLGRTPHAFARAEKLKTARSTIAEEKLFGKLRTENPAVDPAAVETHLGTYIKQPKVSSLWNEAQRELQLGELPQPTGITNFEGLQNFKGKLDDAVSAAFRAGKGNLAVRLREVRDHVVGAVDELVPGYADANREYTRRIRLEEALEAGQQAWRGAGDFNDIRTTRLLFSRLGEGEKREFRKGLASELANELSRQGKNRDVASTLVTGGEATQSKLELVFGNKKTFDEFMSRAMTERRMAMTRGVVGNSKTALRQAEAGADALDVGAAGATGGIAGAGVSAVGAGARAVKGYANKKMAERAAEMLTTKGDDAFDVLARLRRGGSQKIGKTGLGAPLAFTSLIDDL